MSERKLLNLQQKSHSDPSADHVRKPKRIR
jgi:hypothetical protein